MPNFDVLLSPEDYDLFSCNISTGERYPTLWYTSDKGYIKTLLHRLVARRKYMLNLPAKAATGFVVHHINGNSFDARRENLELIQQQVNVLHAAKGKGSSKYLRVSYHTGTGKWASAMSVDSNKIHGGYYDDEVEAAYWSDVWTVRLQKPQAVLNFPDNINLYIEEAKLLSTTLPWKRSLEEVDQKTLTEK